MNLGMNRGLCCCYEEGSWILGRRLCVWREEAKGQEEGPGEEGVAQRPGLVGILELYVLGSGSVSSSGEWCALLPAPDLGLEADRARLLVEGRPGRAGPQGRPGALDVLRSRLRLGGRLSRGWAGYWPWAVGGGQGERAEGIWRLLPSARRGRGPWGVHLSLSLFFALPFSSLPERGVRVGSWGSLPLPGPSLGGCKYFISPSLLWKLLLLTPFFPFA